MPLFLHEVCLVFMLLTACGIVGNMNLFFTEIGDMCIISIISICSRAVLDVWSPVLN